MTPIEKQISELGWTLCESFTGIADTFTRLSVTPPEEVLADVRQIKNEKPK